MKAKKGNVTLYLSRQRTKYGTPDNWEYPMWVFIESKKDKGKGWEQDPMIYREGLADAKKEFADAKASMKDLKQFVWLYAPQIQHHYLEGD